MTPVNAQAIIDQLTENSMAYTTLLRTAVKLQLQIKSTNRNIRRWHEEEEAELIRIMTGDHLPSQRCHQSYPETEEVLRQDYHRSGQTAPHLAMGRENSRRWTSGAGPHDWRDR